MPRWSVLAARGQRYAATAPKRIDSPNDGETVANLTLGDSSAHLNDSSTGQSSADGCFGVDVERETIEVLCAAREELDGLVCVAGRSAERHKGIAR